jgi:hypothetical protein
MFCRPQTQFQPQNKEEHGEERIAEHDNQKIAWNIWYDINLLEKTALKIRNLVGALEKEEISFHEQTAQNLVVETGLEGIESAKRNYNDTTLRQNALKEIEMKKPALMVYSDG